MNIIWSGPLPSTNYSVGRSGHSMQWVSAADPSYIVIHTMVGSMASAEGIFKTPGHQTSAHYGVSATEIRQWVQDSDTAYHSGVWDMNLNSIGIEHEDNGDYNGVRPDALYVNSAQLVRLLCLKYNIPINRTYIIRHNEVPGSSTACPDALDIDRIVHLAANEVVVPPTPTVPDVSIPDGVPGVVFDTATNDRSYVDYASVQFVPGQIADIGAAVVWDRAKFVNGKWLLGLKGEAWALYDDCVDDSDATHDANHSSPPDFVTNPIVKPVPPVIEPKPLPTPIPLPPRPLPPVEPKPVPVAPDPAVSFWAALYAWLKKYFGGS